MLIIVDRFEGDYAVLLEENQTRDVPKQALPQTFGREMLFFRIRTASGKRIQRQRKKENLR